MTFLDGALWDVASKITVSVNKISGEILKKTVGWNAAKIASAKTNGGELQKNTGANSTKTTGGNSKQTSQTKN